MLLTGLARLTTLLTDSLLLTVVLALLTVVKLGVAGTRSRLRVARSRTRSRSLLGSLGTRETLLLLGAVAVIRLLERRVVRRNLLEGLRVVTATRERGGEPSVLPEFGGKENGAISSPVVAVRHAVGVTGVRVHVLSGTGESLLLRLLGSLSLRSRGVRGTGRGRVLGASREGRRRLVARSGSELAVGVVEALREFDDSQ